MKIKILVKKKDIVVKKLRTFFILKINIIMKILKKTSL